MTANEYKWVKEVTWINSRWCFPICDVCLSFVQFWGLEGVQSKFGKRPNFARFLAQHKSCIIYLFFFIIVYSALLLCILPCYCVSCLGVVYLALALCILPCCLVLSESVSFIYCSLQFCHRGYKKCSQACRSHQINCQKHCNKSQNTQVHGFCNLPSKS